MTTKSFFMLCFAIVLAATCIDLKFMMIPERSYGWYAQGKSTIYSDLPDFDSQQAENLASENITMKQGWCGDWTPNGNLGNAHYSPRLKAPLSSDIGICWDSEVGLDYSNTEELYCDPLLLAGKRFPAILALDLQQMPVKQPEYSIVAPSHCASQILRKTAPTICETTVGTWEIVFVLDASWDDSLQVIKTLLLTSECMNSGMQRVRVLVQPTAVQETSSDNLGFTLAASPSHFYIEIQSDMFLAQRGWNRDLVRPMLEYNDVVSVSGRCGHSQGTSSEYRVGRCSQDVEHLSLSMERDTKDAFYVTATNNRGPIAFRADALRELGYLDEVNFRLGNDDHDLNRRAGFLGWHAAYKYVSFYSPLDISPQRNESFKNQMPRAARKAERAYAKFRDRHHRSDCDQRFPAGFANNTPERAIRRRLKPISMSELLSNTTLPPLPPLA